MQKESLERFNKQKGRGNGETQVSNVCVRFLTMVGHPISLRVASSFRIRIHFFGATARSYTAPLV